jgi:hypothetical protein
MKLTFYRYAVNAEPEPCSSQILEPGMLPAKPLIK